MKQLPPAITESVFKMLNSSRASLIKRRFQPLVNDLHKFLNQLPCIADIQDVRKKWSGEQRNRRAFSRFIPEPWHWYTYNYGGRNEAQFSIGLCDKYFRIGLGFEFTVKQRGKPEIVGKSFTCFKDVIEEQLEEFTSFIVTNQLEIEWCQKGFTRTRFIPTAKVVRWILNLRETCDWIFIGRLLKTPFDDLILEDPSELVEVIETVFGGFRPIWEKTQLMAKDLEKSSD